MLSVPGFGVCTDRGLGSDADSTAPSCHFCYRTGTCDTPLAQKLRLPWARLSLCSSVPAVAFTSGNSQLMENKWLAGNGLVKHRICQLTRPARIKRPLTANSYSPVSTAFVFEVRAYLSSSHSNHSPRDD